MKAETHHVLVEEVEDHVGQTVVTPVSVDQHQLPQVFEPGDGEVAGHDGLKRNGTIRRN